LEFLIAERPATIGHPAQAVEERRTEFGAKQVAISRAPRAIAPI